MKEKRDKEEKEKKEEREIERERKYEEREAEKERKFKERQAENDRRYQEASDQRFLTYQAASNQNNKNQTVPYNVITGGTSEVNYSTSTITATSNTQLMLSPSPRTEFVRHHRINRDEETNNPNLIAESVTKKRKAKDNSQQTNKIKMTDTVTTTEHESRTEPSLHDDKNGEDSKQHHDVQNEIESPRLH